ncbi:MAG: glutamate racemase [Rikenellaceae bacterium]
MDSRPIGVFDSGMGGISLWRAIRSALPNESLIYLGDGENCPYGDKRPEQVVEFAFKAVETLLQYSCKMVVIACNTATSTAIGQLRTAYPEIPFVGMEPAVKPACRDTESGIVAVLATKRSLESDMFAETLSKYATNVEVIRRIGEGFVELVERGEEGSEEAYNLVKPIIEEIIDKGVDKIVLGCTHYPFLTKQIERVIAGRKIDIVDPSHAIVCRIIKLLDEYEMTAPSDAELKDEFISFAGESYRKMLVLRAKDTFI